MKHRIVVEVETGEGVKEREIFYMMQSVIDNVNPGFYWNHGVKPSSVRVMRYSRFQAAQKRLEKT